MNLQYNESEFLLLSRHAYKHSCTILCPVAHAIFQSPQPSPSWKLKTYYLGKISGTGPVEVTQNELTSGIVKYLRLLLCLFGGASLIFPFPFLFIFAMLFYHQTEIAFSTVEHLPHKLSCSFYTPLTSDACMSTSMWTTSLEELPFKVEFDPDMRASTIQTSGR